jgi:imidazole glycerol-phosphate synthase subunit HisH
MIRIVDYGLGNILAFLNVYRRLGIEADTARTGEELADASKIVLPGVGAFDHAMQLLGNSGMRATLDELVQDKQVPVLGVCVGMQILARSSDEGSESGLGWIAGRVRSLKSLGQPELLLPHMGWNDVRAVASNGLLQGMDEPRFYFLHSYYFECERAEDVAGVAAYGTDFSCMVHARNIYGVQFHPEKSHRFGTQLLKNFAEL